VAFYSGLSSQSRLLLLCVLPYPVMCCPVVVCVCVSLYLHVFSFFLQRLLLLCCIACCCCCAALLYKLLAHCWSLLWSVLLLCCIAFSRDCCCCTALLYKFCSGFFSFEIATVCCINCLLIHCSLQRLLFIDHESK
jgi:hypothetical protein